jgi:hypothetical protein
LLNMCAKSLWCTYLRLLSALLLAVAVTSCARFALRQQRPEYRLLLDVPCYRHKIKSKFIYPLQPNQCQGDCSDRNSQDTGAEYDCSRKSYVPTAPTSGWTATGATAEDEHVMIGNKVCILSTY